MKPLQKKIKKFEPITQRLDKVEQEIKQVRIN
jgi:hypothetical protein